MKETVMTDDIPDKKTILVFGAAGFIGSYLIDALLSRHFLVTASDIDSSSESYYQEKNIPFKKIDITHKDDFNKLGKSEFDAVIHLAAHQPANISDQQNDPTDYINVNVIGTLNILEYCKRTNAGKLIYGSSHRNTQGLWIEDKPLQESDGRAIKFDTEYTLFSISEAAAQDSVEYYSTQHGLKTITFRLPPVYGYGPHTEIFKDGKPIKTGFQIFIDKAMACESIEVWGDSNTGRDIIYIKDVINAFLAAINHDSASGLFNITSGRKLTLMEEASTIAEVFWGDETAPVIIEKPDIPNNIDSFYYDISKAERELGWTPQYSFKDMLYDFIKETDSEKYSHLLKKRQLNLDKYR